MARKPPKRRCKGRTRAGKRCRSAALTEGDYCRAHDPLLPAEERFGSPEQAARAGGSEKPYVPKLRQTMRRRVEEEAERVLAPYFKALGVEYDGQGQPVHVRGAVMVGRDKEGGVHPSDVEDLMAQIQAAERLLNRVYGKPRQAHELSGPDGGPIVTQYALDLRKLTDDELAQLEELARRVSER